MQEKKQIWAGSTRGATAVVAALPNEPKIIASEGPKIVSWDFSALLPKDGE